MGDLERYDIKVGGRTVYIHVFGSEAVLRVTASLTKTVPFTTEDIKAGAEELVAQYEAEVQAKIDRQNTIAEVQRQVRAEAKGQVAQAV